MFFFLLITVFGSISTVLQGAKGYTKSWMWSVPYFSTSGNYEITAVVPVYKDDDLMGVVGSRHFVFSDSWLAFRIIILNASCRHKLLKSRNLPRLGMECLEGLDVEIAKISDALNTDKISDHGYTYDISFLQASFRPYLSSRFEMIFRWIFSIRRR